MKASVMGVNGDLAGKRFPIGDAPVTLGRGEDNDIVVPDPAASRIHAVLRQEADGFVLADLGSANGTLVNGEVITTRHLRPGDEITVGAHRFSFVPVDAGVVTVPAVGVIPSRATEAQKVTDVLRVTISGGGPVGLAFALLLTDLMGPKVAIRVYNGRWKRDGSRVVWKGIEEGNVRRQQVVTIQSRQFLKLPKEVQDYLFTPGNFTEMWPMGPDSVNDVGPRNIRIAYVEDRLLELANRKRQIELVPEPFDAESARGEMRVQEGLALFGVPEENLTAVTGFQLNMVQRPRFSVRLFPPTATTPGTFGFLLGDSANAIHFWPGRGLNSGLASAISLARRVARPRRGQTLRDADFTRHEAVMSMLQYRHKNRAWLQMVTADDEGNFRAIKDIIAQGVVEGDEGAFDRDADLEALLLRLTQIRDRLAPRVKGMPDDGTLRAHLESLAGPLLHTLLVSGQWDTANVGGEEVDIEWLLEGPPATGPAAQQPTVVPSPS